MERGPSFGSFPLPSLTRWENGASGKGTQKKNLRSMIFIHDGHGVSACPETTGA